MRTTTMLARLLVLVIVMMGISSAAYAQRTVTVHLNTATLPDTLRPVDEIQIRGCLDGCEGDQSALPGDNVIAWNDNTTLLMENQGGDYWSLTFQIPEDVALNYKFYAQRAEDDGIGGWEDGDNHLIAAGTDDVERDLHFYVKGDGQDYDWRPYDVHEDSVAVWFRVYMNTLDVPEAYDPASESMVIKVRGDDFGGEGPLRWDGETRVALSQENGSETHPGYHLFSGVGYYPESLVGETQSFKYYIDGLSLSDGDAYESQGDNRQFMIPANDTTLHWVYFGNARPNDPDLVRVSANIIFTVDVTPLEDINLFNRARGDTVIVRGEFNGYGNCLRGDDSNPDDCMLFEQLDGSFANSIPVSHFPNTDMRYKFFVDFELDDPDHPLNPENNADGGWEEPLEYGGGNRVMRFTGSDIDLGTQYFNNIRPGNVISAGTTVDVTFRVDMTPALSFTSKPKFVPSEDSVRIVFEDPIWIFTQTRARGDIEELPDTYLSDEDGDMIYEGTFSLIGPTYSGIGYRYEYGNSDKQYQLEGDGGFDPGRRRYQYVEPNQGGTWPSEYTMAVVDIQESNPMPFDPNPALVSIEQGKGELPSRVTLDQNYPNPFNPTTTFEYGIPSTQHVRVRIFDALGRTVATLVDEVQPASNYRVTFDAASYASGLYFYQVETATQVVTKKMVLLK